MNTSVSTPFALGLSNPSCKTKKLSWWSSLTAGSVTHAAVNTRQLSGRADVISMFRLQMVVTTFPRTVRRVFGECVLNNCLLLKMLKEQIKNKIYSQLKESVFLHVSSQPIYGKWTF